jgi:hypothetical protein
LAASLVLFQRLLDDERFRSALDWDPEIATEIEIERANNGMLQIGPACCFLGDAVMDQILVECRKQTA